MELSSAIKLRKRFCKDYNLPINLFDDIHFTYYSLLYEFFPRRIWAELNKTIAEKFDDNVELWLDYCAKVRDDAIAETMGTEEYKKFNEASIEIPLIPQVGEHSIYNEVCDGEEFISIDLKKANFQALKAWGVIKDETYGDFICKFDKDGIMNEYLSESKYLRQVIFGKMNPSRTIKAEKAIMAQIYNLIHKSIESRGYEFFSFNSDELIFKKVNKRMRKQPDFKAIEEKIFKSTNGIEVRVEHIMVKRLKITNANGDKVDAYIRTNIESGEETLKKASTLFYPQIYKIWKNMDIVSIDLDFFCEGQMAAFKKKLIYDNSSNI